MRFRLRYLLCLALIPAATFAQITFTLTGTVDGLVTNNAPALTALNYTVGQTVTFSFTTAPSFANNASSSFSTSSNTWSEELLTENSFWASLAGTGISGTYQRPNTTNGSPFMGLVASTGTPSLNIIATDDDGVSIGLTANGHALFSLSAYELGTGASIFPAPLPATYMAPTTFFTSYVGTYALTGGQIRIESADGFAVYATASQLTIASAIPEPSTYAAIFGAAALGFAVWRRRRGAAAGGA
jgi:hypothetical protein